MVVSPDVGGVARARAFAKKLNDAPLAIVDKRRSAHNVSEVMNLIGDVDGKVAVLVDDMIDTAGGCGTEMSGVWLYGVEPLSCVQWMARWQCFWRMSSTQQGSYFVTELSGVWLHSLVLHLRACLMSDEGCEWQGTHKPQQHVRSHAPPLMARTDHAA